MEHLSTIIVGVFGVIGTSWAAWLTYNQRTKDKMTDFKIQQLRRDTKEQSATNNRHIAIVHGVMWELLLKLDADRCFIIQPHPEHKNLFLSVALEVDKKGISGVKDIFQSVPISDMANFTKKMATEVWMYFDDVSGQVEDRKAQSLMYLAGSTQICIRQLIDAKGSWVGSLVVENISMRDYDREQAKETISSAANTIQFILPPIN